MSVQSWLGDFGSRLEQLAAFGKAFSSAAGASGVTDYSVWLGGLFSPAAFLTATRQVVAQAKGLSLADMRLRVVPAAAAAAAAAGGGGGSELSFVGRGLLLECGSWEGGEAATGHLAVSEDLACKLPDMALIWEVRCVVLCC